MKIVKTVKFVVANGALALVLIGAISTPAGAVTVHEQGGNPLAQVFEQLNHQLGSLHSYLDQIVASKLKPLSETLGRDIDAALGDAAGVLGLPDPTKSRIGVEKVATSSDNLVNPTERATNEVDRQITRAAVDSTLGKEGQEQIKQQALETQHSVGLVQQQAQAAQGEVVTQNVMKQIALQNAQTGAVLGALRADSLQSAQRQELTNLNLTNISRSLDGQNQARNSELVGAGFDTFRTAAQAKLF